MLSLLDKITLWYLTRPAPVLRRLQAAYIFLMALLVVGIALDNRSLIAATLPVLGFGCLVTLRSSAVTHRPLSSAGFRMVAAFALLCLCLWLKTLLPR